jgi:hypothetical protein
LFKFGDGGLYGSPFLFYTTMQNTTHWLIWRTDNWHTHASKELIGITGILKSHAINFCKKYAKEKLHCSISKHDLELLETINQTQNFEGSGEFVIERVETNTFL